MEGGGWVDNPITATPLTFKQVFCIFIRFLRVIWCVGVTVVMISIALFFPPWVQPCVGSDIVL